MAHYLDNAATTPVRPEAARAALEAMTEGWGNPSARNALGARAAGQLKQWRAQVAAGLGCFLPLGTVFQLGDAMNGLMALPNLLALFCLGSQLSHRESFPRKILKTAGIFRGLMIK